MRARSLLLLVLISITSLLTVKPSCVFAANLQSNIAGTVVFAKGDEYLKTTATASWRDLKTGDEVNAGNELRTGPFGSLAIVLRDETQIRLRRNTRFLLDDVRNAAEVKTTTLQLIAGAMWSRAQTLSRIVKAAVYQRPKVQIRTSTSTIGIRGTDWFVSVDETTGTSRTVVISGAAEVSNPFGSVSLIAGEEAIAESGKAPVKRVVVDLKGRPLMGLEYTVDWLKLAQGTANSTLTEAATLASQAKFAAASELLDAEFSAVSDEQISIFRIALFMNNAQYEQALALAERAAAAFPTNATFDTLRGHAYLLTDQPEKMFDAIQSALNKNNEHPETWHLRGIYYTLVKPDQTLAISSYEKAIALDSAQVESVNNLALLDFQLGDFESAKDGMQRAREIAPNNALVQANSGYLVQNLDRLADANVYYQTAESLDAANPYLLMARGEKALMLGDHQTAIEHYLSAIAIQPNLPDAHTNLAIAYYQAGRYAEARAMIDKAMEIDPDDPVAPKIGTTMSVDQADVGRAIRLAKEALEKSLEYDYFAVESLESARSGVTNLGAAYASLGLTSWANYYAQLAFTPYEASSHFLLSSVYGARSNTASNGALNLALSIAPTAISEPNRFFEFIREPGIDFTLGGSRGDAGGDRIETGEATVQGFKRLPVPMSYRLDYSDTHNSGSNNKTKTLNISAGTRLGDRRHHFSSNFFATKDHTQNDAPITDIDRGDRAQTSAIAGSVTYHLRLDYDNRIIARLGYQRIDTKTENSRPFGSQISPLAQSFVSNFDTETAQALFDAGLIDLNDILGAPCSATDPCIGIGPFFAPFGPAIDDMLPAMIVGDDFDSALVDSSSKSKSYYFQFRHMLGFNRLDVSYGLEFLKRKSESKFTNSNPDFDGAGIGTLIDDMFNFTSFLLFNTIEETFRTPRDPVYGAAYIQSKYEHSDNLWFESGVFARYFKDDIDRETTHIDPRIGFGWRFSANHWLRAAYQTELIQAVPPLGPVAPVATMGFVPIVTQVLDGSSIKNIQAEWDAEWHARIFTSLRFEQQSIDGWIPLSVPGFFTTVDEAQIRTLDANVNLWLAERFGVFANYIHQASENQTLGMDYGRDLPFVPQKTFSTGLTWVHPKQITASVSMTYVDKRFGDIENEVRLADYWTTNIALRWLPLNKHASIGVSVINLFDEDFEIAEGIRAAGRTATVSLQARF